MSLHRDERIVNNRSLLNTEKQRIKLSKRKYKKYEFCRSVKCPSLIKNCKSRNIDCKFTAKDFHKWLKENNFEILKRKEY